MAQQELIRCIHTDKKTGKQTVKWLAPSVVARAGFMKNYGYRVEHIAKEKTDAIAVGEVKEVQEKEQAVSEAVEFAQSFEGTPEPISFTEDEISSLPAEPLAEKPKKKYAARAPKKVTNK